MTVREIYNRQNSILYPTETHHRDIVVVGLGGIGSWVALDLALSGAVNKLMLYDDDIVELSNLNRTPYKLAHIGRPKTRAIEELITERRMDIPVITVNKKFDEVDAINCLLSDSLIFDCSDSNKLIEIYARAKEKIYNSSMRQYAASYLISYIKFGYDGLEYTIRPEPQPSTWAQEDDGPNYTIIPSLLATPQFLGVVATIIALSMTGRFRDAKKNYLYLSQAQSGDLFKVIKKILFSKPRQRKETLNEKEQEE